MSDRSRGSKKPRRSRRRDSPSAEQPDPLAPGEGRSARVIAHHGVAVLVRDESGFEEQIWLAPGQTAVVGDRVRVARDRLAVLPAEGVLKRFDARGRERTIATNLDRLGIVVAPEPREPPGYIDRGFVIARAAGIAPFVVLNKIDLDDGHVLQDRLVEIYGPSAEVLGVSANEGIGVESVAALIGDEQLAALVGPSGVGKSSLLNALVPELDLRVGELNRGSGKGRHTTTTATLHALASGGYLVDTAGFKDFIAVDLPALDVAFHFPGFEEAVGVGCRFRDCLHRSEPDCAVLEAVAEDRIPMRRHRSYLELQDELAAGSPGRS